MITMDRVRELAGEQHRPVVTTCYLDVDGRRNPRPVDCERHMANLRREVEERLGQANGDLPHDYRMSVRSDLERMERFVAEGFDRSTTRGLAFFACSAEGFFEVVELPFAVENEVALDRRPRLRQLELRLGEQQTCGVALVDRQRLRLLVADATGLHEIGAQEQHVGSWKEQGGWAGPRIQRHADEIARRHFEEFGQTLAEVFAALGVDAVLLAGTEDDLAEFREQLDPQWRERIAGTVSVGTTAPLDEVREAVLQAVERIAAERHEALLQRLDAAVAGEEPSAGGLQAVVDALLEKRLEVLVVSDNYTEPGWRCPACETLALRESACPACGTSMERLDDLVDEVVVRAAGLDARVARADPQRLQRFGQIAAILRW